MPNIEIHMPQIGGKPSPQAEELEQEIRDRLCELPLAHDAVISHCTTHCRELISKKPASSFIRLIGTDTGELRKILDKVIDLMDVEVFPPIEYFPRQSAQDGD